MNSKEILIIIFIVIVSSIIIVFFQMNKSDKYLSSKSNLIEILKSEHKDVFAGAYLDEEGKLNINLVKKNDYIKVVKLIPEDIKVRYVDFTYAELEFIINTLSPEIQNLGIKTIALDEKNNKVVITMGKLDENKINEIKSIVKSSALEFKVTDLEIKY